MDAQYATVTLMALWALFLMKGKRCPACDRPMRKDRPRFCPGCELLVYGDGK